VLNKVVNLCSDVFQSVEKIVHVCYELLNVIAERVVCGHVTGISSIPVITHVRASPFFF
jgi:hypothetical protein